MYSGLGQSPFAVIPSDVASGVQASGSGEVDEETTGSQALADLFSMGTVSTTGTDLSAAPPATNWLLFGGIAFIGLILVDRK